MATFTIPEENRQAVVLALARLSIDRPGWHQHLRETASLFRGHEMFDSFHGLLASEDGEILRGPKLTACQFFAEFERVRARLRRIEGMVVDLVGEEVVQSYGLRPVAQGGHADERPCDEPRKDSPF